MGARLATAAEKAALQALPSSATGGSVDDASDAEATAILHPHRTVPIAGRTVTVREYGYVEGLALLPVCKPFLDALYAVAFRSGPPPAVDAIEEVMARHVLAVQWLIAQSITTYDPANPEGFAAAVGANAKWIAGLDDVEGDLLTVVWWGVNKHFFTRRLHRRAEAETRAARSAGASASASSTPS